MKDGWKVPLAVLSVAGLATAVVVVVLVHTLPAAAQDSCSGVPVNPGADLDAIVNTDPRDQATTFCLKAHSDGTATYNISETLRLRDGDRLIGQTGETVTRGPSTYGVPKVMIRPSGSPDQIIAALGKNIQIQWVDIAGAVGKTTIDGKPQTGTGAGITAGSADGGLLVQYAAIHGNDAGGILNAKGRILNSEFYSNTQKPAFLGFNASAVKGITEYEAAYNYVHDEQGNGIWCDVGCKDDPARAPNGFWVHDNLVVDNGHSGIRYESSPRDLASGVHASEPTALIEGNEVHGNSYDANRGAISVRDAQNALIRNNVFGAKTIAGVSYLANAAEPGAVRASDSGRTDRTDLWNVDIVDNFLNGEVVKGCELPDEVVDCHDTTSPTVGSVAPTEGAATVALDVNVEANFSEPMDPSRITGATFTLTPAVKGATPVAAAVSYDPATNKATLDPNVALQAGKTYSAKVKGGSAGVKDSVGNPLFAHKVWSFTTK